MGVVFEGGYVVRIATSRQSRRGACRGVAILFSSARFLSAQYEKFLMEQNRKFLFWAERPIEVGGETGAAGIERKRAGSAEGAARGGAGASAAAQGAWQLGMSERGFRNVAQLNNTHC